jgi:hypothetical protein
VTASVDRPAHLAPSRPAQPCSDLAAVGVWLASRVAVAVLSIGGAWTLTGAQAGQVEGFLQRWDRWDVGLFRKVAEFGYQGYPGLYPDRGIEAFFPGAPIVLRASTSSSRTGPRPGCSCRWSPAPSPPSP